MYIKISKIREVKVPQRANPGDALDFFIPEDFQTTILKPNKNIVIPSGIKVEVPFGFALLFVNKSGISAKRQMLIGACLVDHGYAGELHIDIHNVGSTDQLLTPGLKIAQAVIINVLVPDVIQVEEDQLYQSVALVSDRGAGGFGSTGH